MGKLIIEQVQLLVLQAVYDTIDIDPSSHSISLDTKLSDDLNFDSLDVGDLSVELDERFESYGLKISNYEIPAINGQKVRDVADYIFKLLNPVAEQARA